jgi:fatty-acyl-CoA synthase
VGRWLRRPPVLDVPRYLRTAHRAGLLEAGTHHPLELLRTVLSRGVGVRSVHAIHAATTPDRLAFVDPHRELTYLEANAEIDALAGALRDHIGVSRGVPVIVCMENRSEYAIAWFALMRLGVTCAHVSRHATAQELDPLVERSGARVVIVSAQTLEIALEVRRRRPELDLRVVCVGGLDGPLPAGVRDYHALVERQATLGNALHVEAGPSDNVVYTSGTTGRPKGAVRDFAAFGALELLQILDRLPLHVGDRHLVVAPMYHSSGQAFTLLNSALGASIWLQERFEPEETLQQLSSLRIDNVFMVPTMIGRILDLDESVHRAHPTPHLQALIAGAAPFNIGLRTRAIERFGAEVVFDFYGATELGWVTLVDGLEMSARPGTVGRAIPGQEIGVFDDEGNRLPPRKIGKVYTRSAQLMQGYMRDEQATREASLGDWLTVDDLGYLDEDGYLYLTGRARDMVLSGGVNIYPAEIEDVLSQHPSISDVAVVGVPDEDWGERLVAVVVATPELELDPDAVQVWARDRMASYKVPREWKIVDGLPRNPTGKVLKGELIRRLS